jgi:hypothetical protein
MATRSTIGMVQEGGTIRSIYCHFDGYPKGVGVTLKNCYTDSATIENLLALGDLSVLDVEIGEKQDFDQRTEGHCLFYGRDRGEDGIDALVHANTDEWLEFRRGSWCEWGYLWDGKGWNIFEITS